MDRDEAIAIIRKEYLCVDRDCGIEKNCGTCDLVMPSKEPILEAFKMAIKALEQEPCEDCISRQAVLDAIDAKAWEFCDYLISKSRNDEQKPVSHFADILRECIREDLTPVTPHYTDAEIQKMQELEQAEIEKAYELGKAERQKAGHWKDIYADDRNEFMIFFCESCGYQYGLVDGQCGWRYGDPIPWKYCPNCGARMVEPQEGGEKE